ncbi:MAG: hypothetical protein GC138_10285 [Gammaproteobacteria bacterium]|nr:hypothetical protein [Gammaproteobacteria bacterium]
MQDTFILLPAERPENAHLLRIPSDVLERDAFRLVTALAAEIEEGSGKDNARELLERLAEKGFTEVPLIVGPQLV